MRAGGGTRSWFPAHPPVYGGLRGERSKAPGSHRGRRLDLFVRPARLRWVERWSARTTPAHSPRFYATLLTNRKRVGGWETRGQGAQPPAYRGYRNARSTTQNASAATIAAAGIVMNHPITMFLATPHRTALTRFVAPTPMIAEVMTWVVETGALKR